MLSSHFFAVVISSTTTHSSHNKLNFNKLINLIISCGRNYLEKFVQRAARNASYTSSDAVTNFLEVIGVWVDEL